MAYQSPFGNYGSDSTSSDYKSTFGNYAAERRKRKEEEEANRNYAEEIRKANEEKRREAEKKRQDEKSLGEKVGDVAGGVWDAATEAYERTGEGLAEIAGEVTGANQKIRDNHAKMQQDQIDTIKLAGEKMEDKNLSDAERARWKNLFENTAEDNTPFEEAQKYNKEQLDRTDPAKNAAAAAEIAIDIATASTLKLATTGAKATFKSATKNGLKEATQKVMSNIGGQGAKQLGKRVAGASALGGAYGVTGTIMEEGDDARADQIAQNVLLGATVGATIPVAGKVGGKALKAGDEAAQKAAQRAAERVQEGAVQRSLQQLGQDGIVGTLDKAVSRGMQRTGYAVEDALNKTKVGSKLVDAKDSFISHWGAENQALYKVLKRADFEGKTEGAFIAAREAIGNSNRSLSYAQDFVENNANMQKLTAALAGRAARGEAGIAVKGKTEAGTVVGESIENAKSGVRKALNKAGLDKKSLLAAGRDFDEFAKVRSDLDLVKAGKKSFSKEKVAELEGRMAKFKDNGFDEEYKALTGFYKDLNDFRLENGLISKQQYDDFAEEGYDYVRQQRELPDWMLEKPASKGRGATASITGSDAIQKRNKFASAEQLSPLETAIKTAQLAHVEAYRNKAAKQVYGLLEDAGEAKLVKSTEMVRTKQNLLKELKEGKVVSNKINRAIKTHKVQARDLKKEIQYLQRDGRRGLNKNIRDVLKEMNAKTKGKDAVISEKQMMDTLVSLETPDLRRLRRMIENRNSKLEPLLDRIESLNGELGDLLTRQKGLYNEARSIKTTVNKGNQTTMSFLDDGVENIVRIDPSIASAIHNWDKQSQNLLTEVMRFSNNVFKYGTTGANVGFALPNFVADQVSSAVNSKTLLKTHNPVNFTHSLFIAMGKPLNAREAEVMRGYLRGNKGQTSINQYTRPATAKKAVGQMLRKQGEGTPQEGLKETLLKGVKNPTQAAKDIRATMKAKGTNAYTLVRHPGEGLRALFDATEGLVGLTENVTRIQNYRGTINAAEKAGRSAADATRLANQAARENSIDFLEAGSYGRVVNNFIPYFNAAIQGNRVLMRNVAERPVSTSARIATLIGAPIAASTIWNTSDPQRKAIYDTIPEYLKDTNFIVITPSAKWNEDTKKWDGVIMMKKPPGVKEFAEPVRKFIEYKADDPDADLGSFLRDEGGSIATDFAGTMQPIDFSTPERTLSSITPQVLKPTAEAILNRNFFQGKDIVGDWMSDKEPEDQKYEKYSQLTTHIAAMFDTSPLKVDHWIRQTFGEVGTNAQHYIDRLSGAPEEAIGGRSLPESISRRFSSPSGGADTEAFYESYNTASSARKRASSRVTELVKAKRFNEARRKAEEYNETISDRFGEFMSKYQDSPNYDPEWDEMINSLRIPTTGQAFKARARQE